MIDANANEGELVDHIKAIRDPEIGRTLGELDMLKRAAVAADGSVDVDVELPTPAYPQRERISAAIERAVAEKLGGSANVRVSFSFDVKGKNTGGSIGLRVKNVVAVGSGKGGVGKSTIAAGLACGLNSYGAKVGLMDADVYGPSLPTLLGVENNKPAAREVTTDSGKTITRIEPIVVDGVKVMSMGFFVEPAQAVVWRGPLLHRAITQFLSETDWGELDYLIIDLPPGTGDVSLTLSQSVGLAGAVVVCTPQQVALLDAVKAISMFGQVKIPVLGIVENMSGEIFGRGGARKKAEELQIPFLGEVPIEADIRIKGDLGQMAAIFSEESPAHEPLRNICEQTSLQIAKQLLETPSMPTFEIL